MGKRPSKSAKMLAIEIEQAVATADYFIVSIYHGGQYVKHPLKTLEIAKQVCPLLETELKAARRAMIYAVSTNGSTVMIPR